MLLQQKNPGQIQGTATGNADRISKSLGSLSPRMTVADIVGGLDIHKLATKDNREEQIIAALEDVALDPECRYRYPMISPVASARTSISFSQDTCPPALVGF